MPITYAAVQVTEGLTVQIGNGDGPPETFTHPASINHDRTVDLTADTVVQKVPRTDNTSAPMKTMRVVTATDSKITGGGVMDAASYNAWVVWWKSGAQKNCKISNSKTGAPILTAPYVCTQLQETGKGQGELVEVQITLEQADDTTLAVAP